MVKIVKDLISDEKARKISFGRGNPRTSVTIHQTDNWSRGANAKAHSKLIHRGFTHGWHWVVDDEVAIQNVEHSYRVWHAGDGNKRYGGNNTSICIESCLHKGIDYKKAIQNTAELTAKILIDENLTIKDVVQHNYWSGKNCPSEIRAERENISWYDFLAMVEKELNKLKNIEDDTKVDEVFNVFNTINAYRTAAGAKNRSNPATKYNQGVYYIYKKYNGMINITKNKGQAGGWINPDDNKTVDVEKIAREVINGNWGNGQERKDRLRNAGYDYRTIQDRVNEILGG